MATRKRRTRAGLGRIAAADGFPPVLYVHGIGAQPLPDPLKREWDLALFGREMGDRTHGLLVRHFARRPGGPSRTERWRKE